MEPGQEKTLNSLINIISSQPSLLYSLLTLEMLSTLRNKIHGYQKSKPTLRHMEVKQWSLTQLNSKHKLLMLVLKIKKLKPLKLKSLEVFLWLIELSNLDIRIWILFISWLLVKMKLDAGQLDKEQLLLKLEELSILISKINSFVLILWNTMTSIDLDQKWLSKQKGFISNKAKPMKCKMETLFISKWEEPKVKKNE